MAWKFVLLQVHVSILASSEQKEIPEQSEAADDDNYKDQFENIDKLDCISDKENEWAIYM